MKKIEEHWSSPEYGDIGFLHYFTYANDPKTNSDPKPRKTIYCKDQKKNVPCQFGEKCHFNHDFTSHGSRSSCQKYDIEQSIKNLTKLDRVWKRV